MGLSPWGTGCFGGPAAPALLVLAAVVPELPLPVPNVSPLSTTAFPKLLWSSRIPVPLTATLVPVGRASAAATWSVPAKTVVAPP